MTKQGCYRTLVLTGVLGLVGGCASVPPVPDHVRARPPQANSATNDDPDSGWLFNSLTGRKAAKREAAPTGGAPQARADSASGVVPASAEQPLLNTPANAAATPQEIPAAGQPQPAAQPARFYPPPGPATVVEPPKKPNGERKDDDFGLEKLAPDSVFLSLKTAAGYGPNEKFARDTFADGEKLFREKKYKEAVGKFATAAERWPDSLLEEDAMFMLGESYFFDDQYSSAHDSFTNLLKKYDNSRYLDTVVKREFALGRYWEQMYDKNPHWPLTPNVTEKTLPWFDTFGHAIDAYTFVITHDPKGPLADQALMARGNAHFVRKEWEDAVANYDLLRKEYPKSKYQVEAHLLGLQAKLHIYQGASYDGTPLAEADEIAQQALEMYNKELGEKKADILHTSKLILEQKADREWAMGQYYEKKRCYGASRYYYQNILKEYPLTQTAENARKRIAEIRDYPDVPVNHFKWLTNLFPAEL